EVSWEALENAGLNPQQLAKTKTGVFVGISNNDYSLRLLSTGGTEIDAYLGTGNAHSTASGRISFSFGFTGPSITLDTACSSSLVAVHLACLSLRNGESNLALVGGVNRILSPEVSINFSKARMLAADGRCKTFDAAADGYVRSEGCGIVVLKRLSDAAADKDRILAVIPGTAINSDGHTSGLTVPNGPSQQAVIRQALENAKVELAQVSYIEAHGTGTPLGDPIELGALSAVFGSSHTAAQPLLVGSVKTNIGHLESAAGIAGLIKAVLQLQYKEIVPHLHFKQPNPYINWEELPIAVPTQPTPWDVQPRIAGVSSFGFSGTNAHIVLTEAPVSEPVAPTPDRPKHLLTLSAKTKTALKELSRRYQQYLSTHPELAIADVCYTANTGRTHFHHRLAIVASSTIELTEKLDSYLAHQEVTGVFTRKISFATAKPKLAFLFTGQGSQYGNMGTELFETSPTFRHTLEQCAEILRSYLDKPLLDLLYREKDQQLLHDTAYTQPALFALEYSLAMLWNSWGIQPDAVMGHSIGEYVAACLAGVFSLEDGLKLIATRGKLMSSLPLGGKMAAVGAGESAVREAVASYPKIAIAALNGPENTVISGDGEAISEICKSLEQEGIKTKALQVSHAFHSSLMKPILTEFEQAAKNITYTKPSIPIISNVTGERVKDDIATPEYWLRHILQPVRFADSIQTLHRLGYQVFLEVGPKPVLLGMGRQLGGENAGVWLPSLRQGMSAWQQILESLAQLYLQEIPIDYSGFDRDYSRCKVVLPNYPWQRQHYWAEVPEIKQPESNLTSILSLIHRGDIQQLVRQLEKVKKIQKSDIELLKILIKENQNEINKNDKIYTIIEEKQDSLISKTDLKLLNKYLDQVENFSEAELKSMLEGEVYNEQY
ncbi:MAG: type I polyketide synthase, partial [Moorea sp. SIO2I5]|nr:type I polyketide synthase [Moorena sp. SIO2I5]